MIRSVGYESIFHRYPSLYRGIVLDANDPEKRGRVRVICPAIGHTRPEHVPASLWATPSFAGAGTGKAQSHGMFMPPEEGDGVWIMFENSMAEFPVYFGGWFRKDYDASEFKDNAPNIRGIKTKAGHTIQFDDRTDSLSVIVSKGNGSGSGSGSKVSLLSDGGVVVLNDNGALLSLGSDGVCSVTAEDGTKVSVGNGKASLISSGSSVDLENGNVTIDANGNVSINAKGQIHLNSRIVKLGANPMQPVARGIELQAWLSSHVHLSAVPGSPTSPPSVPPIVPNNGLSTVVYVE